MTKHFFKIFMICSILGLLGYSIYLHSMMKQVVVIDVLEALDKFKMKSDLEKKAETQLMPLKNKVDSITNILEYMNKKDIKITTAMQEDYAYWNQKAVQTYEYTNKTINEQVWKRLNPLIDQFGKKNGYRIVMGANGMGSILYNEASIDKTDDLVKFINENYAKGEQ